MMKSVLAGFLGTYTSRNCDFEGYWLLGRVPLEAWPPVIDLLEEPAPGPSLVDAARRLAVTRFQEQLQKVGLGVDGLTEAMLHVRQGSRVVSGFRGEVACEGRMFGFAARVTRVDGRMVEYEQTVFVAPHDSTKERRRVPEMWGT